MSYGASVVNSSGFVQIDENYSNYAVLVKGTVSGSGSVYVDFPAQPKLPLVFASFAANDRWLALTDLTNSRATFFIYTDGGGSQAASGSFSYAICVPFEDISLPNDQFGFRVFGPSGQTIFDSRIDMPVVESVHYLNLYGSGTAINEFDIAVPDSGSIPWVLANDIGPVSAHYPSSPLVAIFIGPGFRSPSNSVVTVTGKTIRFTSPADLPFAYSNPTPLVISRIS